MRLKSTNIPEQLKNLGFELTQHLEYRDLWDSDQERVAVFDSKNISEHDRRFFNSALMEAHRKWLLLAKIDKRGQTYGDSQFILGLRCA